MSYIASYLMRLRKCSPNNNYLDYKGFYKSFKNAENAVFVFIR